MCVRGLKRILNYTVTIKRHVARHVRAWIETKIYNLYNYQKNVARHVRAWIETLYMTAYLNMTQSHAMCVRGLKLLK